MAADAHSPEATREVSRRRVVLAGGVGASGLLAACSTGSGDGDEVSPSESVAAAPVATVSELPVGGGIVLFVEGVVLTRPEDGIVKGFDRSCPHQGCGMNEVSDAQMAITSIIQEMEAKGEIIISGRRGEEIIA